MAVCSQRRLWSWCARRANRTAMTTRTAAVASGQVR